jgi:hypothetical protein
MTAVKDSLFGKDRGGRWPNVLVKRYAAQYGASERTVRTIGGAQLARMQPHVRATMFSMLRWDRAHPRSRPSLRGISTRIGPLSALLTNTEKARA